MPKPKTTADLSAAEQERFIEACRRGEPYVEKVYGWRRALVLFCVVVWTAVFYSAVFYLLGRLW